MIGGLFGGLILSAAGAASASASENKQVERIKAVFPEEIAKLQSDTITKEEILTIAETFNSKAIENYSESLKDKYSYRKYYFIVCALCIDDYVNAYFAEKEKNGVWDHPGKGVVEAEKNYIPKFKNKFQELSGLDVSRISITKPQNGFGDIYNHIATKGGRMGASLVGEMDIHFANLAYMNLFTRAIDGLCEREKQKRREQLGKRNNQ